jgi:hypothetical protein
MSIELLFDCWTPSGPAWRNTLLRRARVVGHETDYDHRYYIYICQLLGDDYHDADDCEDVLERILKLENGEIPTFHRIGNAWTVTVTRGGVQIDSHTVPEWDAKSSGRFTLQEFSAALDGWRRFFQLPRSIESRLQVKLTGSNGEP